MTKAEIQLRLENEELKLRLAEAEETLDAIRNGEVDAIIVSGTDGEKVFSLASSETPYRIIIEEMNEGALTLSVDGTILYCNSRFAELLSITMEQIIGSNFFRFVAKHEKQKFDALLQTGKKGRTSGEFTYVSSEGNHKQFLFLINPLPSEMSGDVCIIASDITKLKQKEEELIRSNETLEQRVFERTIELNKEIETRKRNEETLLLHSEMVKNMSEGVSLIGFDDGIIKYVNPKLKQMFGYKTAEMIGKNVSIVNAPTDESPEERAKEIMKTIQQTGEWHGEVLNIKKDGATFWCSANVSVFNHPAYGKVMLSTHSDITERKRVEKALAESEASLQKAQEIAKMGSWYHDFVNSKGIWSENTYLLYGLKPFEIEADFNYFKSRVHPDDLHLVEESIERINKLKTPDEIEIRIILPDGTLKWLEAKLVPIFKDDKLVAVKGTNLDITERKNTELEISLKNEELQKLNVEKDKFFSVIAHDLIGPFNSIIGFSEHLMGQIEKKNFEKSKVFANIIHQSSKRAMDLLLNLMKWAQAQSGRMEFKPEYFEINAIVDEIILLMNDNAKQKSILITNTLPPSIQVNADKEMISTVLRNLISNAIKFTRSGGKIIITTKESQNELVVSVSDSGVGIPKERIDKLFSLSESFSTPGTLKEKGTGLGLILCKEFIGKNNGKIWVESVVGIGTTFYFSLPFSIENRQNIDM